MPFLRLPSCLQTPTRQCRKKKEEDKSPFMDAEEFRKYGKEMVDLVADYWQGLRSQRQPLPDVEPGFMQHLVPAEPPAEPESWKDIFGDIDRVVLEPNTHWHHPRFFAYFPTACSYPAIMADILSGGLSTIGFTWKSGPSMTELELRMLDWLVEALDLPRHFLNSDPGPGCGCIQATASDATLVAILAARAKKVKSVVEATGAKIETTDETGAVMPKTHDPEVFRRFVMYASDQAHSSVEKDAMLAGIRLRRLKSHRTGELDNFSLLPETLEDAVEEDLKRGLVPFLLVATVGTTNTCAVDALDVLGPVCEKYGLWLHVDAAYAGAFAICPELRYLLRGLEFADSFNFNAHKTLQMNFDCSPMWFKDGSEACKFFNVDPVYLRHEHQASVSDMRHLQIALGRRFRALKIWMVMRALGIEKLREQLRQKNARAAEFEELVKSDDVLELFVPRHLGLVCFRIKNKENAVTERLMSLINADHRLHLVPAVVHGVFFIRLAVCSEFTNSDDISWTFGVIKEAVTKAISE